MTEYNKKYENLGEKIANLTTRCKNHDQQALCAKYQDVLLHLYTEVTDQRDKLFLSLGKSNGSPHNEKEEESLTPIVP